MKKTFFFLLIVCCGISVHAQNTESKGKGNTIKAAAPVSKKVEVAKEGTLVSFETNIAAGDLTLTKGYKKGDGTAFETIYTLVKPADPSFNNRKPIRIGISRKSFDSVFTHVSSEMSSKRVILERFIADKKISLDEEKGWVALVKYYNSL